MKTKKEDVLNFLASSEAAGAEKFNQAFELFRKSDNRNPTQERSLNKTGYSETTLNTVLYELQKLHGISENDLRKAKKALAPVLDPIREAFLILDEAVRNSIFAFFKFVNEFGDSKDNVPEEIKNYFEAISIEEEKEKMNNIEDFSIEKFEKAFEKEISQSEYPTEIAAAVEAYRQTRLEATPVIGLQIVSDLKELSPTVDQTKEKLTEAFITAPDEVKNEIKFRDEFPFISDPDLPAELKQLVTEKFNHYYAFADAHTTLSGDLSKQTLTQDEIFQLAKKAVENFKMDQLIRDEFVHYKENKKVLGVHPIFKQRKLQETVNLMTTAELAKRAPLLENYIRRDKGKSEKAANEADKAKYADKVTEWEFELALVNVRLGNSVAK
jgi:hypothetical protein